MFPPAVVTHISALLSACVTGVMLPLGDRVRRPRSDQQPYRMLPEPLVVLVQQWLMKRRSMIACLMEHIVAGRHRPRSYHVARAQAGRGRKAPPRNPAGQAVATGVRLDPPDGAGGGPPRGGAEPAAGRHRDEGDGSASAADGAGLGSAAQRGGREPSPTGGPNPRRVHASPAQSGPRTKRPARRESRSGGRLAGPTTAATASAAAMVGEPLAAGSSDLARARASAGWPGGPGQQPHAARLLGDAAHSNSEAPAGRLVRSGKARSFRYVIETDRMAVVSAISACSTRA